jgi:S1-C subfamily serine protease
VVSAMAGLKGDGRYYQITAPVQKGNSGGPAADMSGSVIGVIQSKLNAMSIQQQYSDMPENVNFATKGDLVRKFLTENGIAYHTQPARETLSAADVADRIKLSMVLVEC